MTTAQLPKRIHHVGYDLLAPGQDYKPLWQYLARIGVRALASAWLVETTLTAAQLAQALNRLIDANDRLLVTELLGNQWANKNLIPPAHDWLVARRP